MPLFHQQGSSTLSRANDLCCESTCPSMKVKRKRASKTSQSRATRFRSSLSGQFVMASFGEGAFRDNERLRILIPCSEPSKLGPSPYSLPIPRGSSYIPRGSGRASSATTMDHDRSSRLYNDPSPRKVPGQGGAAALLATSWYPEPTRCSEYGGKRFPFLEWNAGTAPWNVLKQNTMSLLRSNVAFSSALADRGSRGPLRTNKTSLFQIAGKNYNV